MARYGIAIDTSKCMACYNCFMACKDAPCAKAAVNGAVYTRPDGIVIIDPEKAKGQKQIVEACPNEALFFGDLDDPNSEVSKAAAKERVTPLNGALDTAVIHLNISTIFFAGSVYLPDDEVAENASVELFCAETGDRRAVTTNYFGDWEVEWLDKGRQYEITITYPGCETVKLSVTADTNRYVGEFILAPQK